MIYRLVLIVVIFFPLAGLAQNEVEFVLNGSNGPVPFAHLWLVKENQGVVSDLSGRAVITPKTLPADIEVSAIGFADTIITIRSFGQMEVRLRSVVRELNQVVIGSSLREEKRIEAPTLVSILDMASMERAQAVSLAEGLVYQPGLRVETNCQNCGYSQVRINGMEGAYSQILVNGRPTFSAVNSVYGLDQLPTSMIERVEVVRGASSALNGSNAIAGVINVITRDPGDPELEVSDRYSLIGGESSDHNLSIYGGGSDTTGQTGISVFGNFRNRDSYDRDLDGFSELTSLTSESAGLMFVHKPSELKRLSLDLRVLSEKRRGGSDFDLLPHQSRVTEAIESDVIGAGLTYEQFSKNLRSKWAVYASGQQTAMNNYYGADADPKGYGTSGGRTVVGGVQHQRQIGTRGGQVVLGIEQLIESMYDHKPGYGLSLEQSVYRSSAYGHFDQRVSSRFKWNIGARGDLDNLVEGVLINPRAGLKYDLTKTWNLRLGLAQGYRSPQLISSEMHATLVAGEIQVIRPADDLIAERSYSGSVSLQKTINRKATQMEFVIEGFLMRLTNPFILEEVDRSGVMILEKRNGVAATIHGVNLELNGYSKRFQWSSGLTYNMGRYDEPIYWSSEARDDNPFDQYLRSPNWYGYFNGEYSLGEWSLASQLVYTGAMYQAHYAGYIAEDVMVRTDDFWDLGAKIQKSFILKGHQHLFVELGMKNIMDAYQNDLDQGPSRDASYVYGPSLPRTAYLGLRFKLH